MKGTKQDSLNKIKKSIFIEAIDSYCDEYDKWKKTDIVKRLIGIFEVPAARFNNVDSRDTLDYCGLSHCSVVMYETEFENDPKRGTDVPTGTGFTSALSDRYGRIRPAVFIRQEVVEDADNDPEYSDRSKDAIRLVVLMHELGHAEDIVRQVNFDNEARKLRVLDAEVYAHKFVCAYAKRMDYKLVLTYYLDNLEKGLTSTDDVSRWAAERALNELDIKDLRAACVPHDIADTLGFKKKLEAAGRYEEAMKKFKNLG